MPSEAKPTTKEKPAIKELVKHELQELLFIVVYLAVCFCIIATFKGLVLAQLGLDDFVQFYSVALVEALVLSKVVLLAQKLPILRAFENKPLIWSVLYKSFLLTIIVQIADILEEKIFASITGHSTEPHVHPLIFIFTHACALMLVFLVLFVARELDDELGRGKLAKLVFGNRSAQK